MKKLLITIFTLMLVLLVGCQNAGQAIAQGKNYTAGPCYNSDKTSTSYSGQQGYNPEVFGTIVNLVYTIDGRSNKTGGKNFYAGYIEDRCRSPSVLAETVCPTSTYTGFIAKYYVDVTCPYGCYNGACLNGINVTNTTNSTPAPTCTDTDGKNLFTAGSAASTNPVQLVDDRCGTAGSSALSDSGDSVWEGFCNSNNIAERSNLQACPAGCSNGACLSAPQQTAPALTTSPALTTAPTLGSPDLMIDLSRLNHIWSTGSAGVEVSVKNIGTASSDSSVARLEVEEYKYDQLVRRWGLNELAFGALAPGASTPTSTQALVTFSSAGKYCFRGTADSQARIAELNEENNMAYLCVYVS